ncbi:MAG: FK506-binding protein 2 [Parcubacteria bacterium C7867-004]|nr:MAG: FK506-binding protein 2 [Parcubacteria bacterium C7867-004]
MNVTGNGVAIALAVALAGAFLFFGSSFLTLPFGSQDAAVEVATEEASSTGALVLPVNQNAMDPQEQMAQGELPTVLTASDTVIGTGAEAKTGDTVIVTYIGALPDGTVFDASKNHGDGTFSFTLGEGRVIQGWDKGVVGMKVGGTRQLVIPPDMGYGAGGQGPIPPNATLLFEIELVGIK